MIFPKTYLTAALALIIVAAPVVLFGAGYWVGAEVESAAAAKEKLNAQTEHTKLLDKAFEGYQEKIEAQREKDKEVINGYIAEKNQIELKYRELSRPGSLRLPRSICNQGPVPASAQSEPDTPEGAATTVVLPERTAKDLRRITREADEVTAQCRAIMESIQ